MGAKVDIHAGSDFTFGSPMTNDTQDAKVEISTKSHNMTAGESVKINVSPVAAAASATLDITSIASASVISAAATAAVVAVPLVIEAANGSDKPLAGAAVNSAAVGIGYTAAAALLAANTARGIASMAGRTAGRRRQTRCNVRRHPGWSSRCRS